VSGDLCGGARAEADHRAQFAEMKYVAELEIEKLLLAPDVCFDNGGQEIPAGFWCLTYPICAQQGGHDIRCLLTM